jgi:hypothetical protein
VDDDTKRDLLKLMMVQGNGLGEDQTKASGEKVVWSRPDPQERIVKMLLDHKEGKHVNVNTGCPDCRGREVYSGERFSREISSTTQAVIAEAKKVVWEKRS